LNIVSRGRISTSLEERRDEPLIGAVVTVVLSQGDYSFGDSFEIRIWENAAQVGIVVVEVLLSVGVWSGAGR
jgi:hypothetical protein